MTPRDLDRSADTKLRTRWAWSALVFLSLLSATGWLGCSEDSTEPRDDNPSFAPPDTLELVVPADFPNVQVPGDNPTTVQGVALGRRLFYDPILSDDSTLACAGCHQQENAFADPRRFSPGTRGIHGTRNAPALFNLPWMRNLFWDGRAEGEDDVAAALEAQAVEPVADPIEMNLPWDIAIERLQRHPEYPQLFGEAFGSTEITQDRVVEAIAQFERTLLSTNSRFDQFRRGEIHFTRAESLGLELFFTEVGDCFHCHGNVLGTDARFRDIGLDAVPSDSGLARVTGRPGDFGKFKTPSLRNVEYTAPYMHDGRFETLEEVIRDHYNVGGEPSPNVDPLIRVGIGLGMTDGQIDTLVIFLKTFSDPDFIDNPDFSNPFE